MKTNTDQAVTSTKTKLDSDLKALEGAKLVSTNAIKAREAANTNLTTTQGQKAVKSDQITKTLQPAAAATKAVFDSNKTTQKGLGDTLTQLNTDRPTVEAAATKAQQAADAARPVPDPLNPVRQGRLNTIRTKLIPDQSTTKQNAANAKGVSQQRLDGPDGFRAKQAAATANLKTLKQSETTVRGTLTDLTKSKDQADLTLQGHQKTISTVQSSLRVEGKTYAQALVRRDMGNSIQQARVRIAAEKGATALNSAGAIVRQRAVDTYIKGARDSATLDINTNVAGRQTATKLQGQATTAKGAATAARTSAETSRTAAVETKTAKTLDARRQAELLAGRRAFQQSWADVVKGKKAEAEAAEVAARTAAGNKAAAQGSLVQRTQELGATTTQKNQNAAALDLTRGTIRQADIDAPLFRTKATAASTAATTRAADAAAADTGRNTTAGARDSAANSEAAARASLAAKQGEAATVQATFTKSIGDMATNAAVAVTTKSGELGTIKQAEVDARGAATKATQTRQTAEQTLSTTTGAKNSKSDQVNVLQTKATDTKAKFDSNANQKASIGAELNTLNGQEPGAKAARDTLESQTIMATPFQNAGVPGAKLRRGEIATAIGTKTVAGSLLGRQDAAITTRAGRVAELDGPTGLRKQRGDAAATQQTLTKQAADTKATLDSLAGTKKGVEAEKFIQTKTLESITGNKAVRSANIKKGYYGRDASAKAIEGRKAVATTAANLAGRQVRAAAVDRNVGGARTAAGAEMGEGVGGLRAASGLGATAAGVRTRAQEARNTATGARTNLTTVVRPAKVAEADANVKNRLNTLEPQRAAAGAKANTAKQTAEGAETAARGAAQRKGVAESELKTSSDSLKGAEASRAANDTALATTKGAITKANTDATTLKGLAGDRLAAADGRAADARAADTNRGLEDGTRITMEAEEIAAGGRLAKNKADAAALQASYTKKVADMAASADGTVRSYRDALLGLKNDESARTTAFNTATKARTDMRALLESTQTAKGKKATEVAAATATAAARKAAVDANAAEKSRLAGELDGLAAQDPPLKKGRDDAAAAADAARPVRNPNEGAWGARRSDIAAELPTQRGRKSAAETQRGTRVLELDGPNGLRGRRRNAGVDLESQRAAEAEARAKDAELTGQRSKEVEKLGGLRGTAAVVGGKLTSTTLSRKKALLKSDASLTTLQARKGLTGLTAANLNSRARRIETLDTEVGGARTRSGVDMGTAVPGLRRGAAAGEGAKATRGFAIKTRQDAEAARTSALKKRGGLLDEATANGKIKTTQKGIADAELQRARDAKAAAEAAEVAAIRALGEKVRLEGELKDATGQLTIRLKSLDEGNASLITIRLNIGDAEAAGAKFKQLAAAADADALKRSGDATAADTGRVTQKGEQDAAAAAEAAAAARLAAAKAQADSLSADSAKRIADMKGAANTGVTKLGVNLDSLKAMENGLRGTLFRAGETRVSLGDTLTLIRSGKNAKGAEVTLKGGVKKAAEDAYNANMAESARLRGELDGLVAQDIPLKSQRDRAAADADAARPVRNPNEGTWTGRRTEIDAILKGARTTLGEAQLRRAARVTELDAPTGFRPRRKAADGDMLIAKKTEADLLKAIQDLEGLRANEIGKLEKGKTTKATITALLSKRSELLKKSTLKFDTSKATLAGRKGLTGLTAANLDSRVRRIESLDTEVGGTRTRSALDMNTAVPGLKKSGAAGEGAKATRGFVIRTRQDAEGKRATAVKKLGELGDEAAANATTKTTQKGIADAELQRARDAKAAAEAAEVAAIRAFGEKGRLEAELDTATGQLTIRMRSLDEGNANLFTIRLNIKDAEAAGTKFKELADAAAADALKRSGDATAADTGRTTQKGEQDAATRSEAEAAARLKGLMDSRGTVEANAAKRVGALKTATNAGVQKLGVDLDLLKGMEAGLRSSLLKLGEQHTKLDEALADVRLAIFSKRADVEASKGVKKAADDAYNANRAESTRLRGELDGLVAQEPGMRGVRDKAGDDADAARPVRNPNEGAWSGRRTEIDGLLIGARGRLGEAQLRRAARVTELDTPTGFRPRRKAAAEDLTAAKKTEADLRKAIQDLEGLRATEIGKLEKGNTTKAAITNRLNQQKVLLGKSTLKFDTSKATLAGRKGLAGLTAANLDSRVRRVDTLDTTVGATRLKFGVDSEGLIGGLRRSVAAGDGAKATRGFVIRTRLDAEGKRAAAVKKRGELADEAAANATTKATQRGIADAELQRARDAKAAAEAAELAAIRAFGERVRLEGELNKATGELKITIKSRDDGNDALVIIRANISDAEGFLAKYRRAAEDALDMAGKRARDATDADTGRTTQKGEQDAAARAEAEATTRLKEFMDSRGTVEANAAARVGALKTATNAGVLKLGVDLDLLKGMEAGLRSTLFKLGEQHVKLDEALAAVRLAISSKLVDVDISKGVKKAADDAYNANKAESARLRGELDGLLGQEPGMRGVRDKAADDADAARPVRNPNEGAWGARRAEIDDLLKGLRMELAAAQGKRRGRLVDLDTPETGFRPRRKRAGEDMADLKKQQQDLETAIDGLYTRLKEEGLLLEGAGSKKAAVLASLEAARTRFGDATVRRELVKFALGAKLEIRKIGGLNLKLERGPTDLLIMADRVRAKEDIQDAVIKKRSLDDILDGLFSTRSAAINTRLGAEGELATAKERRGFLGALLDLQLKLLPGRRLDVQKQFDLINSNDAIAKGAEPMAAAARFRLTLARGNYNLAFITLTKTTKTKGDTEIQLQITRDGIKGAEAETISINISLDKINDMIAQRLKDAAEAERMRNLNWADMLLYGKNEADAVERLRLLLAQQLDIQNSHAQRLQKIVDDANGEAGRLKGKLNDEVTIQENLKTGYRNAIKSKFSFNSLLTKLRSDKDAKTKAIQDLEGLPHGARLDANLKLKNELSQKLADLDAEAAPIKQRIDELDGELGRLRDDMKNGTGDMDANVRRHQEITAELDGLRTKLETATLKRLDLLNQLDSLRDKLNLTKEELDALQKRKEELEQQLKDLEDQRRRAVEELEAMRQRMKELGIDIDAAKKRRNLGLDKLALIGAMLLSGLGGPQGQELLPTIAPPVEETAASGPVEAAVEASGAEIPGEDDTAVELPPPPEPPATANNDYNLGYPVGFELGQKEGMADGMRDGKADMEAYVNRGAGAEDPSLQLEALDLTEQENLEAAEVDAGVTELDEFCMKVEEEAAKAGLDPYEGYPECRIVDEEEPMENEPQEGGAAAAAAADFAIEEPVARLTTVPAVADVYGMSSEYNRGYKEGYRAAYPGAYAQGYALGKALVKDNPPKNPKEDVPGTTKPAQADEATDVDFGANFNDPEARFGIGRAPPSYTPYVPPPPQYELTFGFPQVFVHREGEENYPAAEKDQGLTWGVASGGGGESGPPSVASTFLAMAMKAFGATRSKQRKGSRLASLLSEKADRTISV